MYLQMYNIFHIHVYAQLKSAVDISLNGVCQLCYMSVVCFPEVFSVFIVDNKCAKQ